MLEQVPDQTCNFHAYSHGGNRGLQQCDLPSQFFSLISCIAPKKFSATSFNLPSHRYLDQRI
jgi:hypothetical protein